ncbi:MAG: prepilin-type N-terminal cleavage/methylation domain-containing protein, partial [Verrucomicrobiae bacterium]|nr:prepilin-type N-terminal cleavage/methylation domain-containing protein [Verrucomicrobiae bacterium]
MTSETGNEARSRGRFDPASAGFSLLEMVVSLAIIAV